MIITIKKQVSNEFRKYNKNYINKINRRCLDIVGKHFNKPRIPKIFIGSKSRTQITQGYKHLTNKYHNIVGNGLYKYNTIGSYSPGLYINKISDPNSSKPGQKMDQGVRSSKLNKDTQQVERGSRPTMDTTPGCIGSGPRTCPIPPMHTTPGCIGYGPSIHPVTETGRQDTLQTLILNSQIKERN